MKTYLRLLNSSDLLAGLVLLLQVAAGVLLLCSASCSSPTKAEKPFIINRAPLYNPAVQESLKTLE